MLRPSWTGPLVEELEEFTIMPYRLSNVSGCGGNNSSLWSLTTVSKDLFLKKWSCHQSPRINKVENKHFWYSKSIQYIFSFCISTYICYPPKNFSGSVYRIINLPHVEKRTGNTKANTPQPPLEPTKINQPISPTKMKLLMAEIRLTS